MSSMQKFAWFNLVVITITLATVAMLYPFLGDRAMGGMGFLGLTGFGVLFFWQKAGKVLIDERDQLIQVRSWIVAYSLFWVVFVMAAVYLTWMVYGQDGAVPVVVIQMSVAWAFMLVYAVGSIAILIQYAGGSRDASQ